MNQRNSLIHNALVDGPVVIMANILEFDVPSLQPLLSADEYDRMCRFRQTVDTQRYVLSHVLKRLVLSQYLKVDCSDLLFDVNEFGKPFCTHSFSPYFNISHSGDWVVLAVSTNGQVGVDIEFYREVDQSQILKRVCSADQFNRYLCSDKPDETFLAYWTQKEAVAKACGKGISVGLSSIDCSGDVGLGQLFFEGVNYDVYTFSCFEKGVLSFVAESNTNAKPSIQLCTSIDLDRQIVESSLLEL